MMKIVLATFGSRGDVQPMLALSLALQRHGHQVLLVGPPEKAAWAAQLGCPYYPLGADVTACVDATDSVDSPSAILRFIALVRQGIRSQFHWLPKIIRGADLVVGSSLIFALASVAEAMGITYRYIAFAPQLLPSGHHPFPAVKRQDYPLWFNRMTWWLARMVDKLNINGLINQHRRRLGLIPLSDNWLHILGSKVIVATDPAISGIPLDVGPKVVQTGYLHLCQTNPESSQLAAFLYAGTVPVYVGFGSMPRQLQIQAITTVVRAVRRARQRAVIARFRDGVSSEFDKAEDIFFIRNYPHQHLFPKMAAIVHHGGAGTTATAAISGRPQVIVPHILDQYYWGQQIYAANLGPKPIWRSNLTVQRLAKAIEACVNDSRMQQKAKATADKIERTDGLARALQELLS